MSNVTLTNALTLACPTLHTSCAPSPDERALESQLIGHDELMLRFAGACARVCLSQGRLSRTPRCPLMELIVHAKSPRELVTFGFNARQIRNVPLLIEHFARGCRLHSANNMNQFSSRLLLANPRRYTTDSSAHETYIRYRVYAEDDGIPSKTAFDPFKAVSEGARRFLRPPWLANRAIQPSAPYDISDEDIFGIGITTWDGTSFALKIFDLTAEETAAAEEINIGEVTSKVAFGPRDPAIGRIERFRTPVPLSAGSIKRCIAKTGGNNLCLQPSVSKRPLHRIFVQPRAVSVPHRRNSGSTPDKPMV
ncbi:hypothetical protein DFH07DRAFT_775755 [Mycena maculata]|uniref:Uncharacterized protein n=1 Tax=Mycena maculata TaxID=230809 RepID=A0AAD7N6S5_9AGAR|nr:hypothetical protein DFH07DRAFT_775755 [Mycena maculata]